MGVVVLIFRTFGFIGPGYLTDYAMQIGSCLEVVLLSFALRDRINNLKQEKENALRKSTEAKEKSSVKPIVTLSLGIATQIPVPEKDCASTVKEADKALYISKRNGRNQISIAGQTQ